MADVLVVCDRCGGRIHPVVWPSGKRGYRHARGLPLCDSKPPRPGLAVKNPFAVRKLDTEEPWWYVVDLRVDGAVLLAPEAVVERTLSHRAAVALAAELNAAG